MTNRKLERGNEIVALAKALTRNIERLESTICPRSIKITLDQGIDPLTNRTYDSVNIFTDSSMGNGFPELVKHIAELVKDAMIAEREQLQVEFEKL